GAGSSRACSAASAARWPATGSTTSSPAATTAAPTPTTPATATPAPTPAPPTGQAARTPAAATGRRRGHRGRRLGWRRWRRLGWRRWRRRRELVIPSRLCSRRPIAGDNIRRRGRLVETAPAFVCAARAGPSKLLDLHVLVPAVRPVVLEPEVA